ncbi:MAG: type II secretion system protein [Phycisphaerales bacterium]|nr:type II secretion system GspH family protein [Phycisphaerae bacterium]NNM25412.1 type II secretion system protein [Phycisphaerales bacterium]
MKRRSRLHAFTIIELLVAVSIIALLVGILLPAVGKARDQSKLMFSQSNLRNLGTAHESYAAEWADRQFTLVADTIGAWGGSIGTAFQAYYEAAGGELEEHAHPGAILGWGFLENTGDFVLFAYRTHETNPDEQHDGVLNRANCSLTLPISFESTFGHFGAFRLINVQQFHQYVSGKFYDKVFYAPKDDVVIEEITGGGFEGSNCFDDPGEYCDRPHPTGLGEVPVWSSYVLSPAAMFNPQVMSRDDPSDPGANGWIDPWTLGGGFRSPSPSQCLFPSLKTRMLEHHWLQNTQVGCNPGFSPGSYGGCEPYYFNHAWESSPMTLFYDGHVEGVGVRKAMRADGRMRAQTGVANWGLWSKDTFFGEDGYLIDAGYDQAATSFHVLTTDGIRGRDILPD